MRVVRGNDIKLQWNISNCDSGERVDLTQVDNLKVEILSYVSAPKFEWSLEEGNIIISIYGKTTFPGRYSFVASWDRHGSSYIREDDAIEIVSSNNKLSGDDNVCNCINIETLKLSSSIRFYGTGKNVDPGIYLTIEEAKRLYQPKLIVGEGIKIDDNNMISVLSGSSIDIKIPGVIIYSPNSTNDDETGSVLHPYKSLQKAIDNLGENKSILCLPGSEKEDGVKIEGIFGLNLIGFGAVSNPSTIITGNLNIINSANINIKNVMLLGDFNEFGSYNIAFENVIVAGDYTSEGITGSSHHYFINCQFNNVTINGNQNIVFRNCTTYTEQQVCKWTTNHKDCRIDVIDVSRPALVHNLGNIYMDGSTRIGIATGGVGIESTCNAGDGYLHLENGSLKQEDGNLGIIMKTGTCTWYPGKTNFETATSILNGTRDPLGGLQAIQVSSRYNPSNYTLLNDHFGNPDRTLNSYLAGIDNQLGQAVSFSGVLSYKDSVYLVLNNLPEVSELKYFFITDHIYKSLEEELIKSVLTKGYSLVIE